MKEKHSVFVLLDVRKCQKWLALFQGFLRGCRCQCEHLSNGSRISSIGSFARCSKYFLLSLLKEWSQRPKPLMVRSDDNWKQSQILKSQILATWSFSLLTLDNCWSLFTIVLIFWSGPFSCVSSVYSALHGFTKRTACPFQSWCGRASLKVVNSETRVGNRNLFSSALK